MYQATSVNQLDPVTLDAVTSGQKYTVDMIAEYAMLSATERSLLACASTSQIVLHRQALARSKTAASDTRTDINFSGCNSYWFSLFQNQGAATSGSLYTNNYTTAFRELSGSVAVEVGTGVNPMSGVKINADSSPIVDVASNMTQWYNYWWKTGADSCAGIETGHNLIPFCLTTDYSSIEAHGGFINLSKLTNVSEEVTYAGTLGATAFNSSQARYSGDTTGVQQKYTHYILSVSYNIVIIDGGTLTHPYF